MKKLQPNVCLSFAELWMALIPTHPDQPDQLGLCPGSIGEVSLQNDVALRLKPHTE